MAILNHWKLISNFQLDCPQKDTTIDSEINTDVIYASFGGILLVTIFGYMCSMLYSMGLNSASQIFLYIVNNTNFQKCIM